jgi:hypothetical protein
VHILLTSLAALLGAVYAVVIQYAKFRLFGGMSTPVLLRSSGTKVMSSC